MTLDHVIAIGGDIDYNSTKHHNLIPLHKNGAIEGTLI
jgi:hypothetical protein